MNLDASIAYYVLLDKNVFYFTTGHCSKQYKQTQTWCLGKCLTWNNGLLSLIFLNFSSFGFLTTFPTYTRSVSKALLILAFSPYIENLNIDKNKPLKIEKRKHELCVVFNLVFTLERPQTFSQMFNFCGCINRPCNLQVIRWDI